ncbi:MAG TPA: hypothetical protein VJ992_13140 [Gemmatimonadales bacterium]|nr:hypothetical protein [Gemmatimonadales bacterium]
MSTPTREDQQQAQETLAYIRQTMESAASFTAVSGWGLVGVGTAGFLAAAASSRLGGVANLRVWIPTATFAIALSMVANAWKARKLDVALWSGSFRKVVWVMAPMLAAGALLTYGLFRAGQTALLPATWLLLYGAGVTAGGTLSVRAIRSMGVVLLLLGAAALFRPIYGAVLLAAGFGAVHVIFGIVLVQRHGG